MDQVVLYFKRDSLKKTAYESRAAFFYQVTLDSALLQLFPDLFHLLRQLSQGGVLAPENRH